MGLAERIVMNDTYAKLDQMFTERQAIALEKIADELHSLNAALSLIITLAQEEA